MNTSDIYSELKNLGLNSKESEVYLALLKLNIAKPLTLARETRINRTTVYRILERLCETGLAEEVLDSKTTNFRAVDPDQIELILAKKENELIHLKNKLPNLINILSQLKGTATIPTKVVYFKGKEGLEQVLWNTLKAEGKSEVVGYGFLDWNASVGMKFAEKLRREYVEKDIFSREISNQKSTDFTKVNGYIGKHWIGRCIEISKLEICHDTYIYNNVFAYYHSYQGELFGVEIHNAEIAKTQKQIFEILWKEAKRS